MAEIYIDVSDVKGPPPKRPVAYDTAGRNPAAPPPLDLKPLGRAGKIVRGLLPWTEADPAALLLDLVVSFGSAVGPGPHKYAGDVQHPLRLFSVTVGETSAGRKGTARAAIRGLFELAEPEWAQECVGGGLSSGEGLIEAMSQMTEPRRFMAVETEFGKVLAVSSRSGQTISEMVRQLWDGDRVHILNRQATRLEGAFFSLLGHITETELRERMANVDVRNGFGNRILWVYAERSKLLPGGNRIPPEILKPYARQLRRAIAKAQQLGEMRRTGSAEEAWTEWYRREGARRLGGPLGDVTSRREAQCIRLQLIFAVLDEQRRIGAEHVHAAAHVLRYCEASAAYVFGDSTGDRRADKVLAALRATPGRMLPRSDIRAHVLGGGSRLELDAIRDRLVSALRISVETRRSGGRPGELWRLEL